jgi:type II secretory pathway pseudopilin PulG
VVLTRAGTTIAEMLVSLTLAAVVLAVATGSLLRQQRTTTSMTASVESAAQLRLALALLPAQVGHGPASSADLVTGELRDTALQLRTAVATAVSCDSARDPWFALDEDEPASTGLASLPRDGDTLWWYLPDSARWNGRPIVDVRADSADCPAAASPAPGAPRRAVMRLQIEGDETIPRLAPLRVTRQVRLVIYRSGDGSWQLGLREWSPGAMALAAPQPVAGPLQRIAPDGVRSGFRYYDASEVELHPASDRATIDRIARIQFTAVAPPSTTPGSATPPGVRDSVDVVLRPVAAP